MKYIMKNCGCELEKSELIYNKKNGYRCPHHPENKVDYIEKKCVDCPNIMRLAPRASNAMRCPECRVKNKKKIYKRAYKKKSNKQNAKETKCFGPSERNTMDLSLYTKGLDRYLPQIEEGQDVIREH